MKMATLKWWPKLPDYGAKLVNFVHDEFVFEVPNNVAKAEWLQHEVERSIEQVGKDLNLKCPLAGSGGVGLTWYDIH